jgi:hypothetical protein
VRKLETRFIDDPSGQVDYIKMLRVLRPTFSISSLARSQLSQAAWRSAEKLRLMVKAVQAVIVARILYFSYLVLF